MKNSLWNGVIFVETIIIGEVKHDGIYMNESLAFIFMSYLAKEIAYDRRGEIITDNYDYDSYTNYNHIHNPILSFRNCFSKNIINFLVPQNLKDIPFDVLIKFRNSNRDLIKAFNEQLDILDSEISEERLTEKEFINRYMDIRHSLFKAIKEHSVGFIAVPFLFYSMVNSDAHFSEYIGEALAGMQILRDGIVCMRRQGRSSEAMCKKYLVNLTSLQ